ncbi:MAG: type IV pilus twitching motility protein PilT [Oscillospiraceae bacterium]|nr:type IV pilus twitching motility protein PilT [Oscillospiraceae bacterium]
MNISELIIAGRQARASDIHITMDKNPLFRVDGVLRETDYALSKEEKGQMIRSMMDNKQLARFDGGEDVDMSYAVSGNLRQRVNVYRQQKKITASIRIINENIPTFDELQLPEVLRQLADEPRGLILVTGPTGSGKSTTLAAMIDYINQSRACHIITIEDPVEYVYTHKKSLVHQRDVGEDVSSFGAALRSSLREDPDVILVGEMRDFETITAAVTAAETGHLVLSTLHTIGAANTIDRIIDVFPPHSQQQIRTQLAAILKGIVTQTLLPRASGVGRTAAFEIMLGTDAILNLIRENKGHQINSAIQTGGRQGMILLDTFLSNLVMQGTVTKEAALEHANNKLEMINNLSRF